MLPPKPEPPDLAPPPGRSWLAFFLVGIFGILAAALISLLTMGYFLWIFLLAFVIFGIVTLQYLLWGWYFERIYRSNLPPEEDEGEQIV